MKNWILFFLLTQTFTRIIGQHTAHDVLSAGGGTVRTDALHMDWTLGEAAISVYTDTERMVTEGFHQPLLQVEQVIPVPDSHTDAHVKAPAQQLQVFPNPTSGHLTVRLSEPQDGESRFVMMSPAGEIIGQFRLPAGHTEGQLNLMTFPAGIYLLKMIPTGTDAPLVFRITKTN